MSPGPSRRGQVLSALGLSVGRTLPPGAWVARQLETDSPRVAATRPAAADTEASPKDRHGDHRTTHR